MRNEEGEKEKALKEYELRMKGMLLEMDKEKQVHE